MVGVTVSFKWSGDTKVGVIKSFCGDGSCIIVGDDRGVKRIYRVPLREVSAVNFVA